MCGKAGEKGVGSCRTGLVKEKEARAIGMMKDLKNSEREKTGADFSQEHSR